MKHVGLEALGLLPQWRRILWPLLRAWGWRCAGAPRFRSSTPRAPSLPSLPFPGGGAGAARRRPPGRGKAEEAMATKRLEAPGQSPVLLAEATRSSHHILVTILTIGMLLPDLRLLTQVHTLEDRKCKARVWILIQIGDMAHHTPLAPGQILPHTLEPVTHLGMLRPITPQRFGALTVHLPTAQPQSPVGCTPSRTAIPTA